MISSSSYYHCSSVKIELSFDQRPQRSYLESTNDVWLWSRICWVKLWIPWAMVAADLERVLFLSLTLLMICAVAILAQVSYKLT